MFSSSNYITIALNTLLILSVNSCRFNYSPFIVPRYNKNLNKKNVAHIISRDKNPNQIIKLALVSDIHNYYDDFARQIKKINSSGPYDFVIVAGDITNLGLWEEYEQIKDMLSKINYPCLVAIGNHDSLTNGRQIFHELFGSSNFNFVYGNTEFVFFNNNNWETPGRVPDFDQVESTLRSSTQINKILIGHIPIDDNERFSVQEIGNWIELLKEYEVNYIINGHNHGHRIKNWDGIYQITVGSPNQGGLVEMIIDEENISHRLLDY